MSEKIDLNSLRLFFEVINAQSITRASKETGVPKSTISRKLSALERQIGTALLKKGSRKLGTTEAGSQFYEHCRRIVDEAELAQAASTQVQNQLRGILRISIPVDFGMSWIGRALSEFMLAYPDIVLEVDVNSRIVDLREEAYDLTIQLGPLQDTDLTYRRLTTLTRGVYASPGYLQRRGIPYAVDDLHKHDCIVTAQQKHDGIWTLRNSASHRFATIHGKVVVNNISIAREMAIAGVGMCMLPNVMCTNDLKAGRLHRVLEDWRSPSMHVTAMVLSRRGMPKKIRIFLDFFSEKLNVDESLLSA